MKTAGAVVADVFSPFEFASGDDLERNPLLASKRGGLGEMSTSQARRIGDYCEHARSKHAVRGPGEEGRIHSPRIGNQGSAQSANLSVQGGILGTKIGGSGHVYILIQAAPWMRRYLESRRR